MNVCLDRLLAHALHGLFGELLGRRHRGTQELPVPGGELIGAAFPALGDQLGVTRPTAARGQKQAAAQAASRSGARFT
jgi:hypothetical protein